MVESQPATSSPASPHDAEIAGDIAGQRVSAGKGAGSAARAKAGMGTDGGQRGRATTTGSETDGTMELDMYPSAKDAVRC